MSRTIPLVSLALFAVALMGYGCEPFSQVRTAASEKRDVAASETAGARRPSPDEPEPHGDVSSSVLTDLAKAEPRQSVCRSFARKLAEAALAHPGDAEAFIEAVVVEFVGGSDDPFELKEGLRDRQWNQRYFYAGHGGFRPEFDDAQRYPRGGNHQPGHFVSVLVIAARYGEDQARIAIAYAGDYDSGDEDDLRLSNLAIPLGAGLTNGTVTPADVAVRAGELCRK